MNKTLTAAVTALSLAGAMTISTTGAEAKFGRNAFIGGLVGGLVLGGIAAQAHAQPTYGYYGYAPICHIVTKRVFDPYYGWTYRNVRVCR